MCRILIERGDDVFDIRAAWCSNKSKLMDSVSKMYFQFELVDFFLLTALYILQIPKMQRIISCEYMPTFVCIFAY